MQVIIDEEGRIKMVYSDVLARIPGFDCEISRLSSVEPNADGLWEVKFLHEDTPRKPKFEHRSNALAYEQREAEKMLIGGEV